MLIPVRDSKLLIDVIDRWSILYLIDKKDIDILKYNLKKAGILTDEEETEEIPVLVGHLNKKFGWNGYEEAGIGTKVFEFRNQYYFEIKPLNPLHLIKKVNYYKETLKNSIKFINI